MEDSIIHDLLSIKLHRFRKELKNEEDFFSRLEAESRDKLENTFNREQLKLIDAHIHNVVSRQEEIELNYEIKLLNYAIKIGMQLQNAFEQFSGDLNPPIE